VLVCSIPKEPDMPSVSNMQGKCHHTREQLAAMSWFLGVQ
jgi:hypothetical protein